MSPIVAIEMVLSLTSALKQAALLLKTQFCPIRIQNPTKCLIVLFWTWCQCCEWRVCECVLPCSPVAVCRRGCVRGGNYDIRRRKPSRPSSYCWSWWSRCSGRKATRLFWLMSSSHEEISAPVLTAALCLFPVLVLTLPTAPIAAEGL